MPFVAGIDVRGVVVVLILVHLVSCAGDERAVGVMHGGGIDTFVAGTAGDASRYDIVSCGVGVCRCAEFELNSAPDRRVIRHGILEVGGFLRSRRRCIPLSVARCLRIRTLRWLPLSRLSWNEPTLPILNSRVALSAQQRSFLMSACHRYRQGFELRLEIGTYSVFRVFRHFETDSRCLPLARVGALFDLVLAALLSLAKP